MLFPQLNTKKSGRSEQLPVMISAMNQLAEVGYANCRTEVITGSTRMKAGSAQKMVLNMFQRDYG